MILKNPWVGYLARTYQDVKESILNRVRATVPEVTDLNESNIFVILISIFSGISEQLNYYIDDRAQESFLATAKRYSSVIKLVKLLDYRVRAANPASVDLYFTYTNAIGTPVAITEPGVIPQGTVLRTSSGMTWITTKSIEVQIGTSYAKVSAKQLEPLDTINLGITTNQPNQEYVIPGKYAHGSMQISINGENWQNVNSFALSLPTDKHYIVEVGEDRLPRVTFGNGQYGEIPPAGQDILADYSITEGQAGNNISRGTINQVVSILTIPVPATTIRVRNEYPPSGGLDMEDIESIRFNAPLTTKTVERAVTASDFDYLSQRAPGVAKASSVYQCGVDVDIYISPVGGGIASESLLEETQEYLDSVKSITPQITVRAAGETPILLELNVTPYHRGNRVDITNEVINTLLEQFSFENNAINGRVAISDVIATIDNLPKIDTVDLIKLTTLPYATPINHNDPLIWERETLQNSTIKQRWRLTFDGVTFRFFKGASLINVVQMNVVYTDPEGIIKFRIDPEGMYVEGQTWEFITYPYNKNITLDDNTVPVLTAGTIKINVLNPKIS